MYRLNRRQLLSRARLLAAMHAPLLLPRASAAPDLPDVPPVRFNHLTLMTQPLEAMRRFYGETLGFPILRQQKDSFTLVAGDSSIEFRRAATDSKPFYHFAFSIAENKIEQAKTWTEQRTEVLTQSRTDKQIIHFRNWNAHALYFRDPAGNIGEFIAHHTLSTASTGEFTLEDVLYTSEIGLVVEDVREATREIEPLLGLEEARRGSRNFAAVGDARGYFILVPNERIWLPTDDVQAEPHPVHARFASRRTATTTLKAGPFDLNSVRG